MILVIPFLLVTAVGWLILVIAPVAGVLAIARHDDREIAIWERKAWWWYLGLVAMPGTVFFMVVELRFLWGQLSVLLGV